MQVQLEVPREAWSTSRNVMGGVVLAPQLRQRGRDLVPDASVPELTTAESQRSWSNAV